LNLSLSNEPTKFFCTDRDRISRDIWMFRKNLRTAAFNSRTEHVAYLFLDDRAKAGSFFENQYVPAGLPSKAAQSPVPQALNRKVEGASLLKGLVNK